MLKHIFFLWVQLFFGVIAISYLVSLKYPGFEPKHIYSTLIFSFIMAVILQFIRTRRANVRAK